MPQLFIGINQESMFLNKMINNPFYRLYGQINQGLYECSFDAYQHCPEIIKKIDEELARISDSKKRAELIKARTDLSDSLTSRTKSMDRLLSDSLRYKTGGEENDMPK